MEGKFILYCIVFALLSAYIIAFGPYPIWDVAIVLPIAFVLLYFGLKLGYKFADFFMSIVWPEKK